MTPVNSEHPVLIYDRIDANRRKTVILLALFSVILLPPLLFWGNYLWFWMILGALLALPGLQEMSPLPKASLFEYLLIRTFSREVLEKTDPGWTAVPEFILMSVVLVVVYLEYRYGSSLILRLTRPNPVNPEKEKDLDRIVENLCIGAGLPKPQLYIMESQAPNAFAAGRNPENACVVVTRGLLRLLDRRELEGVIAHELSHIGNYDIRLNTVVTAIVWTLKLPPALVVKSVRLLFRVNSVLGVICLLWLITVGAGIVLAAVSFYAEIMNDPKTRPVAMVLFAGLAAGLYVFFVAPLLGLFMRLVISRGREFLADADAVLLTRYPEGLARALAKISAVGDTGIRVNPVTAHLYVVDPLPKRPWWERIFSSHPPVEERIAVLARMGSGIPASVLKAAEQEGTKYRYSEADIDAGPLAAKLPSGESAVSAQPRPHARVFRLTGSSIPLYRGPNAASAQLEQLEKGAIVVVADCEKDFLRVITSDGTAGFIPSSASMTSVDIIGSHNLSKRRSSS